MGDVWRVVAALDRVEAVQANRLSALHLLEQCGVDRISGTQLRWHGQHSRRKNGALLRRSAATDFDKNDPPEKTRSNRRDESHRVVDPTHNSPLPLHSCQARRMPCGTKSSTVHWKAGRMTNAA